MNKNICLKHLMLFFWATFMCINSFFVCGFAENSTPSKDQQPTIKDKAVFDFQDSEEMQRLMNLSLKTLLIQCILQYLCQASLLHITILVL